MYVYGVVLGGFQKLAIYRTCIQCTGTWDMDPWSRGGWSQNAWIVASVLKKKSYSVLVFSIIIFFSVDNSYNRIDPSDQVKQEKENTGNETRLVCSYKKMLVCLPTHLAMQILSKFVWLEKQTRQKNRGTSRKENNCKVLQTPRSANRALYMCHATNKGKGICLFLKKRKRKKTKEKGIMPMIYSSNASTLNSRASAMGSSSLVPYNGRPSAVSCPRKSGSKSGLVSSSVAT